MMREPVASYVISNSGSINIYEADSDYVLAGLNGEEPEECEVVYEEDETTGEFEPHFKWGELLIPLSECMRLR